MGGCVVEVRRECVNEDAIGFVCAVSRGLAGERSADYCALMVFGRAELDLLAVVGGDELVAC